MFERVGTNHYRHTDGYEVWVKDRFLLAYKDETCSATVAAEFPPETVIIFQRTLTVLGPNGVQVGDKGVKAAIVDRMRNAMAIYYKVLVE